MECQDVRQLLAFFERKSEELDAVERDALRKHLNACPDCAAVSAQERGIDQSLGAAMRDVPIPAGLKQQVLQRLARERGGKPWKRWAAAAVLLLAIGGGTSWYVLHRPVLTIDDVNWNIDTAWTPDSVEQHLKNQGLTVRAPDKFDYRYLQQVDVVEVRDRRVARLTFRNDDASATVFIVDAKQFNSEQLKDDTRVMIRVGGDQLAGFTYVILYSGNLQSLENQIIQQ